MTRPGSGVRRLGWFVAAGVVLFAAACGDDDAGGLADDIPDDVPHEDAGDADGRLSPPPESSTTPDLETGGIEIDAPEGWQEIPLPALGFGVAIPQGWEALVLSDEGLASLRNASPAVPGFAVSATAAARSGAVFYAAGIENPGGVDSVVEGAGGEGDSGTMSVVDLKVRADTASGVDDVDSLEDYARQAPGAGLPGARIEGVADTPEPTVDIRYRDEHGTADPDTTDPDTSDAGITVEGTERLVLAGSGVVYSFIVTSEDAATHDDLAPRLLATTSFPPD